MIKVEFLNGTDMKIRYIAGSLACLLMVACQDTFKETPVEPAVTGDEITFGSSLTDIQTRTVYGDKTEGEDGKFYYPVSWEDGDQISVYCPEAAQGKIVKYKITPDHNDPSRSAAVTKIYADEAGLQWGQEETHHFSAFYPGDRILESVGGKLRATIPVNQDPVEWKSESNGVGTTYTGVANTDYAFMWAYNTHDKSDGRSDVALNFKPWVTILDVEINGPAKAGESIKMSSVQLRSLGGETLNGEFLIDFNPVEDNVKNYPTYEEYGNPNATRSQVSIQLYANAIDGVAFNDFITLRHGDKIVVRFYLLPKDVNYDTSGEGRNDLQIRVTPFNSAVLTRTLNAQEGAHGGGILAHKVNKVILPSVSQTGPNYWMSSLDPNIYVTELSLPGSKMSYQTTGNGASVAYQNLSIADQVTNGIRAFQIQTASTNTGALSWDGGNASDQVLYATVAGSKTRTRFHEIVSKIATGLKDAEAKGRNNEYAFILLTAALGQCDDYGRRISGTHVDGNQAWMDAIRTELALMAADEDMYRLYTGEITPSTTIGDVAGHIIIKVNYNDDTMGNHLNADDRIPAMFAKWGTFDDVTTPFEETNAYAINSMRWGTSNKVESGALQWFYHEATGVGYNDASGGDDGETQSVKMANIKDMWERSVGYYNSNSDHNMWFLNDVGGCYVNGGYSSGESQSGVDAWTQYVGPEVTQYLQSRTADATLGIVLLNYADPNNQYTGNLIQTIINNNFNFQLRTAGSSQAENYNATYSNGGNAIGWEE